MPQSSKPTICIIGAGIGGLTAGALLSKEGFPVTIFEKEQYLGGRALSFDAGNIKPTEYLNLLHRFHVNLPFAEPDLTTIFANKLLNGYKLDLGYHAIGGGVLSNINSVLLAVDKQIDILESRVGFINEKGYDFPFLSGGDKLRILPDILHLVLAGEKTMKQLDDVPITETIRRYGKGKMKLILEIFSRSISTVNNLERISTGEMFRAQKNLLRGSKPVGYPKQGLEVIHKKLAQAIENNHGILHLGKPVEKIMIDDHQAKSIIVNGSEQQFDIVVSNNLAQELFTLCDPSQFPKEYVLMLQSLTGTASLCAYYSLTTIQPNLIGKTFHFIERDIGVEGNDAVGMIDFMASSPESGLAPTNHYLVQSYIICNPMEAQNKKTLMVLKQLLDKNLDHLIPGYQKNLRWALYPAVYHLDGVAKTIDNPKPDITTPIRNLYLIGDCVKAPGIGINCAVNSARILTDLLVKKNM